MIRILADTGIRVGELVGLRTVDLVDRDRSVYLRVSGKGSRERLVPVPRLHLRLRRFAERGRPKGAVSDRLFLSQRRRPGGDYEPLSTHAVEQLVRYLGQRAELSKRVYPHLLRHSAATWMLQKNMNPLLVARILGHSSLDMIQNVYAHLSPEDAYAALYKALVDE
jgi:integrase